ncbi:hypothetical protein [Spiroplasma endosymbiont of Polydrusus pterygomalis]|uniref:hypothetical protein n=1 Tax=Spiroplasma endosymbiont of Polydrusus pterygomalis TaxID=3139327 RepID=UPI003CCB1005
MKKLLSLLSVLTIGGSAVPTTIAASPYQKKEKLNIIKREIKTDIYFSCSGDKIFTKGRITGIFNPNSWERIIHNYQKNNPYQYDYIFKSLIEKHKNRGVQSEYVGEINDGNCDDLPETLIARPIFNSWNQINDVWQKSNRQKRIKITVACNVFSNSYYLESVNIIDDGAIYENNYINNFNNDFNNSRQKRSTNNSNNIINLELIEDNNNVSILNKIKYLYPKLDISQFEIINKSEYSGFTESFSAELVVKNNSNVYSAGLSKKLIFNTKTKINEIKNKIINDPLFKQWKSHIDNWKNNLNSSSEWKETAKGYIRDLSIILRIINNTSKIEELNKTVKGIKESIDTLTNMINKLDNKIQNLENSNSDSSLDWCQNVGWGVSVAAGASAFTGIGEIISIIAGSVAVLCGVIDTLSS